MMEWTAVLGIYVNIPRLANPFRVGCLSLNRICKELHKNEGFSLCNKLIKADKVKDYLFLLIYYSPAKGRNSFVLNLL